MQLVPSSAKNFEAAAKARREQRANEATDAADQAVKAAEDASQAASDAEIKAQLAPNEDNAKAAIEARQLAESLQATAQAKQAAAKVARKAAGLDKPRWLIPLFGGLGLAAAGAVVVLFLL